MRRIIRFAVAALVMLGLLIQLIPYGRDHTNPPVKAEPQHVDEFQKVYLENSVPPWYYSLLHPATKLGYGEKQQLFARLAVLAGKSAH